MLFVTSGKIHELYFAHHERELRVLERVFYVIYLFTHRGPNLKFDTAV